MATLLSLDDHSRADLWRYSPLLPLTEVPAGLPMGEGWTPLLRADNLGLLLGLPHLYIKDERRGPTASFKDRQAAVTTAVLRLAGVREAVVASTGNVALAYSAYCSRVGIQLWAFLTSRVPAAKMHEVALYGTQVVKVTSTYDRKDLAAELPRVTAITSTRRQRGIGRSMKTIAFEVAEQLGAVAGASGWRAPDWYVQAVSGGVGPHGVWKGFHELVQMGLIDRIPRIAVIQAEGCAPMVRAWKAGLDEAEPVEAPSTRIFTLSTGDPGRSYTLLRRRLMEGTGGAFESVSDEEAIQAMHLLPRWKECRRSRQPGRFAGLIEVAQQDDPPEDHVVVNLRHSMPVKKKPGRGWFRDRRSRPGRAGRRRAPGAETSICA
jgi:threonine synthase